MLITEKAAIRFWNKLDKSDSESCWEHPGVCRDGYPQVAVSYEGVKRVYTASRMSWFLTNGFIPKGIFVCHGCDNPKCCNPKHLFLGTQTDNMRDMILKGRSNNIVYNKEHHRIMIEKSRSEESRNKRKASFARIGHQKGINSSQYGTCWLKHPEQMTSIKVKLEESPAYLDKGWIRGRFMKADLSGLSKL